MSLRSLGRNSPARREEHREGTVAVVTRPRQTPRDTFLLYLTGFVAGPRTLAALRELERAQWLPPEELQQRSEARLAPMLRHAAENVPFYRETYRRLGLPPDALRSVDDLTRLPIVSKATHREFAPGHFLAGNVPAYRRLEDRTSGSTGEPFRFYVDRHAQPGVLAGHLLFDSWHGIHPLDRNVRIRRPGACMSRPQESMPSLVRLRHEIRRHLKAAYEARTQHLISVWEASGEQAVAVYRRLEALRPRYVHGYASTLAMLADELLRRDLHLTRPVRGIINFAETLTPPRRRLIEQYFNAPVINRYGMREIYSYCAQSCPVSPEQFHVDSERVVWETVREDGSPAAPGEVGRVVLTALDNFVMPFIRYDTGDRAVAAGAPCPCGRGLPLVGPIDGRSSECLITPSGKRISPLALGAYLILDQDLVDIVRQYQLVQEAPHRVRLLIVPALEQDPAQQDRLRQELAQLLVRFLGSEMTVAVDTVAEIPAEPSGKRLVIKPMPDQEPPERT